MVSSTQTQGTSYLRPSPLPFRPPAEMRAAEPDSPLARIVGLFSKPAGDEVELFLRNQRALVTQNPLAQVLKLLGADNPQSMFGGPAVRYAGKVLPFVQRTGGLRAAEVPGLKAGIELVQDIRSAPSVRKKVTEGLAHMQRRLLNSSMTLDDVFEQQPRVSRARVDQLLNQHGVPVDERQIFRFEVKPDEEGFFDLSKVLAWLGY